MSTLAAGLAGGVVRESTGSTVY
ncbi:VENN motif pre-toxin domain-containing protein [Pantoea sp. JKS000250]